jgi:hypothetical protein
MTNERSVIERAREISQVALDHGWDAPTWDNFLAKLMLVMTEVQEAEDASTHDEAVMELADVVIRTLNVLFTLNGDGPVPMEEPLPPSDDLLLRTRQVLCRSAEFYRRGMDGRALGELWDLIVGIERWCTERGCDIWVFVDKKTEINRDRPRMHGKKRSIG